MNNIYFIIIAIFCMIFVFVNVRKKKFSISESFWWMVASVVMLLLAIFPYSIDYVAKLIGVNYPPSLFFVLCIIFLVTMIFRNSKRISAQQEKIIELGQQVSILKAKVEEDKNSKR